MVPVTPSLTLITRLLFGRKFYRSLRIVQLCTIVTYLLTLHLSLFLTDPCDRQVEHRLCWRVPRYLPHQRRRWGTGGGDSGCTIRRRRRRRLSMLWDFFPGSFKCTNDNVELSSIMIAQHSMKHVLGLNSNKLTSCGLIFLIVFLVQARRIAWLHAAEQLLYRSYALWDRFLTS